MNKNIEEEIKTYISSLPEPKRGEVQELHRIVLKISPQTKLWFFDGRNSENKVVSNPNIGYGFQILNYANGESKEWFQIGISPNKTGISVYILSIKDRTYLIKTYANSIGKASVTGYCIKFKSLKDIHLDKLEAAIRDGFKNKQNTSAET